MDEFKYSAISLPNGNKLSFITNDPSQNSMFSNVCVILIHGANRKLQNAEHWKDHYKFLATLGT